ncbi:protein of unknown function (plasmid) [Cardinium endosymbiont cEper1 of Encarsia pergandiella]|nr:protein of unknown function [Cardinium endosymbiont cEper1 of Encarsia pergandiella]
MHQEEPSTSETDEKAPSPKKPKREDKKAEKELPKAVRPEDKENLRKECVEMLNSLAKKELKASLPKDYIKFLVEYDIESLEKLAIDPFCIFSFKTPKSKENIENKSKQLMRRQIGLISVISIDEDQRKRLGIKNPWCIAVYNGEEEEEYKEYYYIDLDSKNNTIIYKQDRYSNLENIYKILPDFIKYCKEKSNDMKKYKK